MARTIPEETIADIKARADLATIIGRSVKLRRVGRNLVGLCPFHTEKSPSFNVSPDEGFFYCFGCKAAGDVVSFLERTSGRGFLDIVTELAEQTGVELPKVELDPAEEARQQERKRILRALELAQVFFRTRLASDEGSIARAYLAEVRKIDEATIDSFGMGYGGGRDDGLATFLKEQGVAAADGVAAGVLAKPRDEVDRPARAPFDFFRHRVTVPIRGPRGFVLSFQGRIFGEREIAPDGSKRPKYINGPQSVVYDKGAALFGLFESLAGMKKGSPAVIVEGPLDAIAVHRSGVPSAVAPCGTSLTPRHIDELKRRGEKVIVCMDADKAGRDASERAILMMLQAGLEVCLVALPDKDPDQMMHAGRGEELRGLILGAPSALDALIAKARTAATGNVSARMHALDALLPFLAAPQRDLVRAEAVRATARAFNEDNDVIAREVDKRGRKLLGDRLRTTVAREVPRAAAGAREASEGAPPPREVSRPVVSSPVAAHETPVPARMRRPVRPLSEPEVMLVEALLTHPHLVVRCGVLVSALRNSELRSFIGRLTEALVRFHEEEPRLVLGRVPMHKDGQIRGVVLKVAQAAGLEPLQSGAWRFARPDAYLSEAAAGRIIEDAILRLDRRVLELRLGELQALLAGADERGDHGERKRVLMEQATLVDALKALGQPARSLAKPGEASPSFGLPPRPVAGFLEGALAQAHATTAEEQSAQAKPPALEPSAVDDAADPPWAGDPDDDPWAV